MHLINNRKVEIFSCYEFNIPEKLIKYQKKVFDFFDMEINQEYTTLSHPDYLDNKINSLDFDILIFFDIDCVPLKPNLYEYIVNSISDNNTIIGVEQSNQSKNPDFVYAGPSCFGLTSEVFQKLNKPSFLPTQRADVGGEFTFIAKENNVSIKLFNITTSLNKKWKCGNKKFGNGTIYDDWLYHQFEVGRYYGYPEQKIFEYQFINQCKKVLND